MEHLTTDIKTEVASNDAAVKVENEIRDIRISLDKSNPAITVRYDKITSSKSTGEILNVDKKQVYEVRKNPNNLPMVRPMIPDPNNDGEEIEDANVAIFDPAQDEYCQWVNGETGVSIAAAVLTKLNTLNGTPE